MQVESKGCDLGKLEPDHADPRPLGRIRGGRLFQTSLSILTLEVYYRFLPLYRNADAQPRTEEFHAEALNRRNPAVLSDQG